LDPAGFEVTIPTSEQPQTQALDGAATGNGQLTLNNIMKLENWTKRIGKNVKERVRKQS